jgi:hypothetical protein
MNVARLLRDLVWGTATCKWCGRRIDTKTPEFHSTWAQIRDERGRDFSLTPTRARRITGGEVCPECQTSTERRGTRVVHRDYQSGDRSLGWASVSE